MFDPASRFQLVADAMQNPGMCFITRVTRGPFVDTGLVLNKFDQIWSETNQSRIYLSVAVLQEMAEGAGLFDEERERSLVKETEAYRRGLTEGAYEGGELVAAADRLVGAAERLRVGPVDAGSEASGGDVGPEPDVLVLDGVASEAVSDDEPEPASARGQGNGARRQRRSVGVSGDSGDGSSNPFKL